MIIAHWRLELAVITWPTDWILMKPLLHVNIYQELLTIRSLIDELTIQQQSIAELDVMQLLGWKLSPVVFYH